MAQPLFIFVADTHLHTSAWSDRPTLRGDSYWAFEQIVNMCLHYRVPLILGGDSFDTKKPPPDAVACFCQQMDRMQAAGLRVLFIRGQHDLTMPAWLNVHAWPEHIDGQLVDLGDSRGIFGLDWTPRGDFQQRLAAVPVGTTFLVTHTVWDDFMGVGNTDGSFTDLPQHVPFVLTGDYHVHTIRQGTLPNGVLQTIASPGSTCLQAVNEPPEKFVFLVQHEPANNQIVLTPLRLQSRSVLQVEIMSQESLEHFKTLGPAFAPLPSLHPSIATPIVRVRYLETLPEVYDTILQVAAPVDRIFLDAVEAVRDDVEVNYAAMPVGAFDGLANAVQSLAGADVQAATDALRILRAENPAAELDKMYQEFVAAQPPFQL